MCINSGINIWVFFFVIPPCSETRLPNQVNRPRTQAVLHIICLRRTRQEAVDSALQDSNQNCLNEVRHRGLKQTY